jgi:hypothetical protein
MDGRDERSGEVERELGGARERDLAELAEIQATIARLRELRGRIAQGQLEPDDLALFLTLLETVKTT